MSFYHMLWVSEEFSITSGNIVTCISHYQVSLHKITLYTEHILANTL